MDSYYDIFLDAVLYKNRWGTQFAVISIPFVQNLQSASISLYSLHLLASFSRGIHLGDGDGEAVHAGLDWNLHLPKQGEVGQWTLLVSGFWIRQTLLAGEES